MCCVRLEANSWPGHLRSRGVLISPLPDWVHRMSANQNRNHRTSEDGSLHELQEAIHDYAQQYWRHVLVALLSVAVVLVGYHSWRKTRRTERAQTWQKLNELPPLSSLMFRQDRVEQQRKIIEQCKDLLTNRWETPATPWVLLKLANAQLAAERTLAAHQTLQRLRRDFPDHYATRMASQVRAAVMEDMGNYEEAAQLYKQLAREGGKDSPFWVDTGRAWEMAGRREMAQDAYRKVASLDKAEGADQFPMASFRLKVLKQGGELLSPPPEPPAPPGPKKQSEGGADAATPPGDAGSPAPTILDPPDMEPDTAPEPPNDEPPAPDVNGEDEPGENNNPG